jgi:hypothetical protein
MSNKNKIISGLVLLVYSILNLRIFTDVVFSEYGKNWWVIGLNQGSSGLVVLGVVTCLFLNVAIIIYWLKNI